MEQTQDTNLVGLLQMLQQGVSEDVRLSNGPVYSGPFIIYIPNRSPEKAQAMAQIRLRDQIAPAMNRMQALPKEDRLRVRGEHELGIVYRCYEQIADGSCQPSAFPSLHTYASSLLDSITMFFR